MHYVNTGVSRSKIFWVGEYPSGTFRFKKIDGSFWNGETFRFADYINLITVDPDDNKFVDCAISANAHYIVTNDHHYDVLKDIDFPKVNIVNIQQFCIYLSQEK